VAPESRAARRARARAIVNQLEQAYAPVRIELDYRTDLELLVAVILSAQCTDRRVNLVTPALFARFPTVRDYARARPAEVARFIKSCGLYRAKARAIVAAARALEHGHGGVIPRTRQALRLLPGVGPKTAGVVTLHLEGGEPAFPVDTHVGRLARRLGLSRAEKPDRVEEDLQALLPPERWGVAHQLLVRHGRRCCTARRPECGRCPVRPWCPQIGVKAKEKRRPGAALQRRPRRFLARRSRVPALG
jgi:endonuclease-3